MHDCLKNEHSIYLMYCLYCLMKLSFWPKYIPLRLVRWKLQAMNPCPQHFHSWSEQTSMSTCNPFLKCWIYNPQSRSCFELEISNDSNWSSVLLHLTCVHVCMSAYPKPCFIGKNDNTVKVILTDKPPGLQVATPPFT